MRPATRAIALAAAVVLPLAAQARTVDEAEAKRIEERLLQHLPETFARGGALDVSPEGDHFEVRLDIRNALAKAIAPWTVSEATPIVHTLTEAAGGLWELAATGTFKLATEFAAAKRSSSLQFTIGSIDSKVTFDPAIGFPRKTDLKLGDIALGMRSAQESLKLGMKDFELKSSVEDTQPGVGNIIAEISGSELSQTSGAFPNPEVRISGETMSGSHEVRGVDFAGIAKLVAFWNGSAAGKTTDRLTAAERAELAAIAAAHRPFVSQAKGETSVGKLAISSGGKRFLIDSLAYRWSFEDIASDGAIVAGMTLENPTVDPGVWPAGVEQALPKSIGFSFRYHGFKFGPMWDMLSDPKAAGDVSTLSSDELARTLLPDGRVTVEIKDTYARSPYYDLGVEGHYYMRAGERGDRYEADIDITARDFDKTVKFLQDNAKTVPVFGRAATYALMAKGLGKPQPDGSTLWNLKIDEAGKITINGQPLPV